MVINVNASNKDNLTRTEILQWVNRTLKINCKKVEELANGSAYCMLMERLFPGSVQMWRIKAKTVVEYDYIHNLKILQKAFNELHITREIPIHELVKGNFMHNVEFAQWFYKFFIANESNNAKNQSKDSMKGKYHGLIKGKTTQVEKIKSLIARGRQTGDSRVCTQKKRTIACSMPSTPAASARASIIRKVDEKPIKTTHDYTRDIGVCNASDRQEDAGEHKIVPIDDDVFF